MFDKDTEKDIFFLYSYQIKFCSPFSLNFCRQTIKPNNEQSILLADKYSIVRS